MAAVGIILLDLYEKGKTKEEIDKKKASAIHFWLIVIIQFAFGGLFSTFIVFYFRSTTLSVSWPFFLILFVYLVGNEIFKKHYSRLSFQISALFLATYSFSIFIAPIIMHRIGDDVFIISGLVSLGFLAIFISLLYFVAREKFHPGKLRLFISISGIFVVINVLYFTNLIPPLPLSLKDAGVYHNLVSDGKGGYAVKGEVKSWINFFQTEVFHRVSGEPVYLYTAVFSPTFLNTNISHDWQYFDESKNRWITSADIRVSIVGGRDGGYRMYSKKYYVSPGLWRVDVKNDTGQILGRIMFVIQDATSSPDLITEQK